MQTLVVLTLGIIGLSGTAAFPIVAFRQYKEEGASLFAVCWGVAAISFTILVWAVVIGGWWAVFVGAE